MTSTNTIRTLFVGAAIGSCATLLGAHIAVDLLVLPKENNPNMMSTKEMMSMIYITQRTIEDASLVAPDRDVLLRGAIDGMLSNIDTYSRHVSSEYLDRHNGIANGVAAPPPDLNPRVIDDIGYINLQSFSHPKTADHIATTLTTMQGAGINKYIIDLRNNPGGSLASARDVIDLFVDSNEAIFSVRGRNPKQRHTELATPGDILNGAKLAVLIDHDTASAAELTAGALQKLNRATVIGTQSFGKGSVQNLMSFEAWGLNRVDGFKVTIAHYFGPKGLVVQDIGITPDIGIQNNSQSSSPPPQAICSIDGVNEAAQIAATNLSLTMTDHALLCAIDHVRGTTTFSNTRPHHAPISSPASNPASNPAPNQTPGPAPTLII